RRRGASRGQNRQDRDGYISGPGLGRLERRGAETEPTAAETPAAAAILRRLFTKAGIGRCLPFSQALMVLKVTPISRASCSCVRLRTARSRLTRAGISGLDITGRLIGGRRRTSVI